MPHVMQGQAAETQSPSPMLEARWATVQHNSSMLYFHQATLSLQVCPLPNVSNTHLGEQHHIKHSAYLCIKLSNLKGSTACRRLTWQLRRSLQMSWSI